MNTKYLYLMFPNVEKRRKFIINCSLTFGLRLETLADILGENKEKIYIVINKINIINISFFILSPNFLLFQRNLQKY